MLGFSALSEAPISATAEVDDGSARAFVNLPTVDVTPAAPTVSASSNISVAAPEITVTAPEPTASGSAITEVQANTIALTPAESVATGAGEATFSDLIDVGITAPEETLSVGSLVSVQSNTLTITAPEPTAFIASNASAESNTVTVTAPESQGSVDVTAIARLSPIQTGDEALGGFYAGDIYDSYEDKTVSLIVAPRDSGTDLLQWKTSDTTTSALYPLENGFVTTYQINNSQHPAANFTANLNINGYTDWYLPAQSELITVFNALGPRITSAPDFQNGGSQAFQPTLYWTTREDWINDLWDAARMVDFDRATPNTSPQYFLGFKTSNRYVRAIRRVDADVFASPLQQVTPPQAEATVSSAVIKNVVVDTVNVITPTVSATGVSTVITNVDFPSVSVTAPTVEATASSTIEVASNQISVSAAEPTITGNAEASVTSNTVQVSEPEATPLTGIGGTGNAQTIPDVTVSAPGVIGSVNVIADTANQSITVSAPISEADGIEQVIISADAPEIQVVPAESTQSSDSIASTQPSEVIVTTPEPTPSADVNTSDSLPTITVSPAIAVAASDRVLVEIDLPTIQVTAPEAEFGISSQTDAQRATVNLEAPEAFAFIFNPDADRTIIVAAEDRDIEIAFENRTIVVT